MKFLALFLISSLSFASGVYTTPEQRPQILERILEKKVEVPIREIESRTVTTNVVTEHPQRIHVHGSASVDVDANTSVLIVHSDETIQSLEIKLPKLPENGQRLSVATDSTILSVSLVGAKQVGAPVSLASGSSFKVVWSELDSKWFSY